MELTFQIFLVTVAYTETGLTIKWKNKMLTLTVNARPEGQPADVAVYSARMPDLTRCSDMHAACPSGTEPAREQMPLDWKELDHVPISFDGTSQLRCQSHTSNESWPKYQFLLTETR
jgi:hypothetical protein